MAVAQAPDNSLSLYAVAVYALLGPISGLIAVAAIGLWKVTGSFVNKIRAANR